MAGRPDSLIKILKEKPTMLRNSLFWIVMYLVMLASVWGGGHAFRRWALATYSTNTAQAQWDEWRADVKAQQGTPQPVTRRLPKSPAPPALVLMRDHFLTCQVIAMVLSSALFATFMLMIKGSVSSPPSSTDGSASPPIATR